MCHVMSRGLRKFRTAYTNDVNCSYCSVSHSVPPLSYISGVTMMTRKPSDNDLLPHIRSERNKVLRRGVCQAAHGSRRFRYHKHFIIKAQCSGGPPLSLSSTRLQNSDSLLVPLCSLSAPYRQEARTVSFQPT
jgi:hypothetical protein